MKYIIFLFLFLSSSISAQKTYPYLLIDSVGDQFVILTLEQAQKLDNATEFSPILWKENSTYYKVIDSLCNRKIEIKDIEIDSLKSTESFLLEKILVLENMNDELKNVVKISNSQIYDYEITLNSYVKENNQLYDDIIEKEKTIKKQNRNMNIAIGFGIVATIVSFIIGI